MHFGIFFRKIKCVKPAMTLKFGGMMRLGQ